MGENTQYGYITGDGKGAGWNRDTHDVKKKGSTTISQNSRKRFTNREVF